MKLEDIKKGLICVEKQAAKHTIKKQIIEVVAIRKQYELNKKTYKGYKNYTYVYYKTCNNQFYPAANTSENSPLFLDGLVGCTLLTDFKKQFNIL